MGAGGGKDLKPPGQYKNREEVIAALKEAQPEIVEPQNMLQRMMIITQFYSMGVIDSYDKRRFARIARNTTLSIFAGFGLSLVGWNLTNKFLYELPRRSRVVGRSFISFVAFIVPCFLVQQYNEKIITDMQKDYTERYIDFMLTNDMSKLSKSLAEEMKKSGGPRPNVWFTYINQEL